MILAFGVRFEHFFTVDNAFTILLNITAIGIAAFGSALLLISRQRRPVDRRHVRADRGRHRTGRPRHAERARWRSCRARAAAPPSASSTAGWSGILRDQPADRDPRHGGDPTAASPIVVTDARSVFGFPRVVPGHRPHRDRARCRCRSSSRPSCSWSAASSCSRRWSGCTSTPSAATPRSAQLAGIRPTGSSTTCSPSTACLIGLVAVLTTVPAGQRPAAASAAQFELDVLTAVILGGIAFTGGAATRWAALRRHHHRRRSMPASSSPGCRTSGSRSSRARSCCSPSARDQLAIRRREQGRDTPAKRRRGPRRRTRGRWHDRAAVAPTRTMSIGDVRSSSCATLSQVLRHGRGRALGVSSRSARVRSSASWATTAPARARSSRCSAAPSRPMRARSWSTASPVRLEQPARRAPAGHRDGIPGPRAVPEPRRRATTWSLARSRFGCPLGPIVDPRRPSRRARGDRVALAQLGIALDDDERPVRLLSGGQRQSVAIARIAGEGVKVGHPRRADRGPWCQADPQRARPGPRRSRARGSAVSSSATTSTPCSSVADRVVVLRLGRVVHEGTTSDLTHVDLVHLMAGLSVGLPGPTVAAYPAHGSASPA